MKKYIFKLYNKNFPKLFDREKERILSVMKESLIIDHVGSTAIPGLGGKGIIDIVIATEKQKIDSVAKLLEALGYEFKVSGGTVDRLFFQTDLPDEDEESRRYHIHLVCLNSKDLTEMLSFRNYLRNHPEDTCKYAEVKKKAAESANEDRDKYMQLKTPVIEEILEKIRRLS